MDTGILIFIIALVIVQFVVFYLLIQAATKAEAQEKHQRTIVRLMVSQMQKSGYTDKDIEAMLYAHPNLPLTDNPKE